MLCLLLFVVVISSSAHLLKWVTVPLKRKYIMTIWDSAFYNVCFVFVFCCYFVVVFCFNLGVSISMVMYVICATESV